MGAAVLFRGGCRVVTEPAGACLVSHTGYRDVVFHVGEAMDQVVGVHVQFPEERLELLEQLLLQDVVRRRVAQCEPA